MALTDPSLIPGWNAQTPSQTPANNAQTWTTINHSHVDETVSPTATRDVTAQTLDPTYP
jgi:hypothetical protein